MVAEESVKFLVQSGYFTNCLISEGQFIGRSVINDALWRVRPLPQAGYEVWQKMPHADIWTRKESVRGITSVIGVLSDADDEWIDWQKDRKKQKKQAR